MIAINASLSDDGLNNYDDDNLSHSDRGRKSSGGEESEESELDEETELMKKIMGFNKFDTTKVCALNQGWSIIPTK